MEFPGGLLPEAVVWDPQPMSENLTLKRLLCLTPDQIRELAQNPGGGPLPQESFHSFWNSLLELGNHIRIIPSAHLKDVVQEYAWRLRYSDQNDQLLELRKLARVEAAHQAKTAKKMISTKKNAEECMETGWVVNRW